MMTESGDLLEKKHIVARLYGEGRLVEALRVCEEICAVGYRDPGILCLLGVIYGHFSQYEKSAAFCRQAIAFYPEYIDAHYHLACALRQLGYADEAINKFEFVLSRRPGDADVCYRLGTAREWTGDYCGAISAYRRARELRPGYTDAIASEAAVYEKQGEPEKAYAIIRPYVEDKIPDNGMIAIIYGHLAPALGMLDTAIAKLEQVLAKVPLSQDISLQLHFVLGMLYDRKGLYDDAFKHYREGNKGRGAAFDSHGFRLQIDALINRFDPENMARSYRSDCRSEKPVFVVGMMRSGTSLVEQILASHSRVFGAGELPHLDRIVGSMVAETPDITRYPQERLNHYASLYLDAIEAVSCGAERVVDKMPQNFMHLGYIALLFPGARIIHCCRDPVDTCLSSYFQNFAAAHSYTFDLEDMGRCYVGYRRLMAHWRQVLNVDIHELSYEKLVSDPEAEIANLLEYCDLDNEPGCLRFNEHRRTVTTASYDQVHRPLYKSSVGRSRNYMRYIGELERILGQ